MTTAKTRDRPLLRLAARIAERLSPRPAVPAPMSDPFAARLRLVADKSRLLAHAQAKGWGRAAAELRGDLAYQLDRLAEQSRSAAEALRRPVRPAPRPAEVLGELRQLAEEFDDVRCDLKAGTVSAVVGPVTLEGVRLGRFRLVLDLSRLGPDADAGAVRAEALDPNPASSDAGVTHPHVRDGRICAGEGEAPVRTALREGRLSDAFLILRGVLYHYAEDSPYVRLDEWDGTACSSCGDRVAAGDSYHCDGCGDDVCDGCSSVCRHCDEVRCDGCLEPCAACRSRCCSGCREATGPDDREVCPACRRSCPECGGEFVQDELDAATGRCAGCAENAAEAAVA